jgi:hypothetical protein
MIIAVKIKLLSGMYATGPWDGLIEIEAAASLEDLHLAIQDALEFDNDHMFYFFTARTERSRERVAFDDENGEVYEKTIASVFPLPKGHHLYYLFDFGDSWKFAISKARAAVKPVKVTAGPAPTYPRLVSQAGERPVQYPSMED